MDVQGVSISPPTIKAFLNVGMSDSPTSSQSGTGMNKNYDAANQSGTGMLRYRSEKLDAGMPMPAASTSMPMSSYIYYVLTLLHPVCCGDVPADLCGRSAERSGHVYYYIY
jgi:hypothetical protein